ncbi:MAG TPA: hypothetical protein VK712_03645, partial [Verrucomicrobiae bacterium]|nr:hypothetical protein [Verrucomicrobiae bacterium]
MALEIATTQEQSAEQDLAEQRQILHKVAQGVGEAAALNFRRAFCVAKARLIMGHVGVTRVDTGESIGR